MTKVNLDGRPLHFIGIGGIGMSALAHIVAQRQLPVSGSDVRKSHITDRLESLGAKVFYSQKAKNIESITATNSFTSQPKIALTERNEETVTVLDETLNINSFGLPQIICSTAIAESNPEYQAAIQLGCPIFHRSDVLAALI